MPPPRSRRPSTSGSLRGRGARAPTRTMRSLRAGRSCDERGVARVRSQPVARERHPLLERLASADPGERRAACLAAADDPSGVLLADGLAGMLGDPVKAVVRAASDALVAIARRAGGVDEALRRALHGDEPLLRWGAALTTARLEPPGPRLLPA